MVVERPVAHYRSEPCFFCGQIVKSTDETAYEEITSFVQRPQMHGAVLRDYTGVLAHEDCVKKQRDHIAQDQASLL